MPHDLSLAELSLFPATPDQILESRKRTAVQWARGRSLEDYVAIESIMDKHEHATGGKFIVWVLAPMCNPTTSGFLCSCETFRRTALVSRPGASVNEVNEAIAYGIASVFTPPQNRRKGYARHMMRLLHWVLAPRSALPAVFPPEWGTPPDIDMLTSLGVANAQFSVLYSDVGPAFYRSCGTDAKSANGWAVVGAHETFWVLANDQVGGDNDDPARTASRETPVNSEVKVELLTEDEVLQLYEHDALWMRADLSRRPNRRIQFTFQPDEGVGAMVMRRLMRLGPNTQPTLPLSIWGAVVLPHDASSIADVLAAADEEPLAFVTWTRDALALQAEPSTLVISRLRTDEATFPGLLNALLGFARQEKVDKVEFWYLPPELRARLAARGWKTVERAEHLSALKWYSKAQAVETPEDSLEWVYNEKFCWC